jgi:Tfp pilus assembly protein FimT
MQTKKIQAFSLIELILVIIILAGIILFVVPNLDFLNRAKTLTAASESLYNALKITKSESTKLRSNLTVSFNTGNNWCFGVSDSGGSCDCSVANSCQIGGVEKVVNSQMYTGITLTVNNLSGSNPRFVEFEGIRGTVTNTGSITFANTGYSTTTSLNKLGLISICSDTVRSYTACTP